MYQVNLGSKILYYPGNGDYSIYDTELSEDIGQAGEFKFKVPPTNPLYGSLAAGELVTVLQDGIEYWRGEIKEINTDFAKVADVYCVEDLAWLADEFLTPAAITNETYAQRFQAALTAYNANRSADRQFTVGYLTNVTSSDACNWVTEYEWSILDDIRTCIAKDTGYLRIRRVTSGGVVTRYLDCVRLQDYGVQATQSIEYGYNLLNYVKESDYGNLVNVLTPYGAELDSEVYDGYNARLQGTTITNATSVTAYGRHAKTVIFDGVSDATDLNALAAAYLTRYSQPQLTMQVEAVDLAQIENVNSINIGDSVRVVAKPFAVDQWLYLTSIVRDLQNVEKNKITLSGYVQSRRTLTEQAAGTAEAVKNLPSKSSILDAARKNALEILNGTEGGYVKFQTDSDDHITELTIQNAELDENVTKRWRWNLGGLAYQERPTASDDWDLYPPTTAMTMDGGFVANFITTGTLSCDRLNGGKINGQEIEGGTITGSIITSYRGNNTSNGYTAISGGNCMVIADANNYFQVISKADSGLYVTMGPEITVNDTSASFRIQCSLRYLGWAVYDAYQAHSSDKNLKERIADIPVSESKDVILGARPRYYEFKDKTEKGIRSGFVAQELREALDRIGNDTAIERESARREGEREVIYEDFIAHLVNTVQDLYAEVDALKAEINNMKGVKHG